MADSSYVTASLKKRMIGCIGMKPDMRFSTDAVT